jgi:acyl-CoA reductase-like NAD-dependent aldehyde dehydrogenase
VDAAVAAANAAFVKWRAWPGAKRRQLLLKFADLLERDQEELGFLTRLTLGAPYLAFENFRCKTCQLRLESGVADRDF